MIYTITDSRGYPCTPEAASLSRIQFSAGFCVRPTDESATFAALTSNGESFRRDRIRKFMNKVRSNLLIRNRDWFWAGVSECGFTEVGHSHVLIALDPLTRTRNPIPSAKELESVLRKLLPEEFPRPHFSTDVTFHANESNQSKAISYFTKLENQEEKNFFFAREAGRELFNVDKFKIREPMPLYTRDWDGSNEEFTLTPLSASAQ